MNTNDTLMQYFEWYLPNDGTFWKKAKTNAKQLAKDGITAVWLPPAYKGASGINDVGYGVYDMYDLGEFDQKGAIRTKYGTKKEYVDCVKELQKQNVAVVGDIVFNHRMGADKREEVKAIEDAPSDREEDISGVTTIEAWTKYTFPGRKGKYSTFTWDSSCFDGTDWDDNAHASNIYRFQGHQWDDQVDSEDGNYDYLMGDDLDMSNPKVIKELKDWGEWYLDTVPLDGVRLDAVKHIRFSFFEDWLKNMNAYCKRTLFAVGEYWNSDVGKLLYYLDKNAYCLSLFDVSLHYRLFEASNSSGNYDMGSILNDTLVSQAPMNAVTFVDNHDSQPGQALESFIQRWFKPLAYGIILLREGGLPCVFYGDYYGIPHDNIPPIDEIKPMVKVRHDYAYGNQNDYFDHQDVIGWTREGDEDHPLSGIAVVLSDGPGGEKNMYIGKSHAGQTYVDILKHQGNEVTIDENGNGNFSCDGGSISVWINKDIKQ